MKFFLETFLVFFLFLKSLFLFAEDEKPFIINFTKEVYRAGDQNWSLSIDDEGIVFFANNKGLLEFDGSNWFLQKMPEGEALRAVFAEEKNRIYVGAYEEFGYWKKNINGEKTYFSLSNSLTTEAFHNDEIWKIISLNDDIYFQSFSKIFKYDGKKITIIDPKSSIVFLLKARNRLFIQLIGKGLYELKNDKLVLLKGSEFLANDEVKFVLPFRDNDFLIGASKNGILVYDNFNFSAIKTPIAKRIRDSKINNGIVLENKFAIGTITNGIFIITEDGDFQNHLNTSACLQNNTVLGLKADSKNNLWVALDRGIDYVEMNSMIDFYVDPFYKIGAVYAAVLKNNDLWIGTNKGLYKYVFDNKKQIYINTGMIDGSQGQVLDLYIIDNEILCGHTNGTYSLKGGNFKKISDFNGAYDFKKISFNGEEILLQSTYSNLVVYKKSKNGWRFSNFIDGFIEPIPDIEQDNFGNFWAAHLKKGVFKFKLNNNLDKIQNIKYYVEKNGFKNDKEIQISKIDNRIVFTNGSIVYTYDDLNDTIIPYKNINEQFEENVEIKKIIQIDENYYWFVTQNNISLFLKDNEIFKQKFSYNLYRQGFYLSADYPKIISLKNNYNLICLDKGFALFHFKKDLINNLPDKLLMRKIIIFNNKNVKKFLPLNSIKNNEIPFSFRNIKFVYSSSEITKKPLYRYKIKGLNENFSNWSSKSYTEINRLPYGKYKFVVQSKTVENNFLDPLVYSFEILPPFYFNTISFVIYGFIIFFLLLFGIISFKRILKKNKRKVEKFEKEKREQELLKSKQKYVDLKNKNLQSELYYKNIQLANHAIIISNRNDLLIKIKKNINNLKKEMGGRLPDSFYKKQISLLNSHISSDDEWKTFEGYFDQIHQDYFKRLISQYSDLTQSDLKLCAYLRLNLSSKEIASLLNISLRGVEARRYRLRKRLNFEHDKNLVEFLLKI
ncbi:MAG: hypothetical protein IMY72_04880 [Bacteroidetes bacterium]|nr:hypothetical protein [Bacteroidota bacterium]